MTNVLSKPPKTAHPSQWYLGRDGTQYGPLTDAEMKKLAALGHLKKDDLVWRPGFSEWALAPAVFPEARQTEHKPEATPVASKNPTSTSLVNRPGLFISYSKSDRHEAQTLSAALEGRGFHCWWDISLLPGDSFRDTIDSNLSAARAAVVIWTPTSRTSSWVIAEADHAFRDGKLINSHTADLDASREIPKPFNTLHSVPTDDYSALTNALVKMGVPKAP